MTDTIKRSEGVVGKAIVMIFILIVAGYLITLGVFGLLDGETKDLGTKWKILHPVVMFYGVSGKFIAFGYIGMGVSLLMTPLNDVFHGIVKGRDVVIASSFILLISGYILSSFMI